MIINYKSIKNISIKNKVYFAISCIISLLWLLILKDSLANNKIYLLFSVLTIGLLFFQILKTDKNPITDISTKQLLLAGLLSLLVTVANYNIYQVNITSISIVKLLIILITSLYIFYNIVYSLNYLYNSINYSKSIYSNKSMSIYFWLTFLLCLSIDLLYLLLVANPGNLTQDSIAQIRNIITGEYSNHHPVAHTLIIEFFIRLGWRMGRDINFGILLSSIFQAVIMSLTIAYIIKSLCQIGAHKIFVIITIIFFALTPYHWVNSVSMIKDVPFAIAIAFFIISLYKCRCNIGKTECNLLVLFLSTIGVNLMRSNGIYAIALVLIILMFISLPNKRSIIDICLLASLISVVIKGPVYKAYNVTSPDTAESLSIPLQQIGRYIAEEGPLSSDERDYLNTIMDVDSVSDAYSVWISDPMKNLVRDHDGNQIIEENKSKFLTTWVGLGLKQPSSYISAWVDMTKAYYNAAYYNGGIFFNGLSDNDYGIKKTTILTQLDPVITRIDSLMSGHLITATGVLVWAYILIIGLSIIDHRKTYIECLPLIALVATLLIATPVNNSFRYVYALYFAIPFCLATFLIKE